MHTHLVRPRTMWPWSAAIAAVFTATIGCVGEAGPTPAPDTPPPGLELSQTAHETIESTASAEFDQVVVDARYDATGEQIIAEVTDRADGAPRGTLTWHVATRAMDWQLPGEQISLPVHDARSDVAPSLAQAIQTAYDQWSASEELAEGGDQPYCWYCTALCPQMVGMYNCYQTVTCQTELNCTPDGCKEEQKCGPEWRCDWVWERVWVCCDWLCWI